MLAAIGDMLKITLKQCGLCYNKMIPDDFVIATGKSHSVREFIEKAFGHIGITINWHGHGMQEYGFDASTNKKINIH